MIATGNGVIFVSILYFFGVFLVYSNAVLLLCGSIRVSVSWFCVGVGAGRDCRTLGANAVVPDCSDTLGDETVGVESSAAGIVCDEGIDSIQFICVADLSNALRTGSLAERDGVVDDSALVSIVIMS